MAFHSRDPVGDVEIHPERHSHKADTVSPTHIKFVQSFLSLEDYNIAVTT